MAKCGCGGGTCSCIITAGRGTQVKGNGTLTNPYVIESDTMVLNVTDTATINLTLSGSGLAADPYVVKADFVGTLMPPNFQDSESRNWSGAVSLADVTVPKTIRATLTGNVTSITLPTWSSAKAGSIMLVLYQDATGGRTWVQPGTSAGGVDVVLSTAPGARDLVEFFWTGIQWIVTARALNVS